MRVLWVLVLALAALGCNKPADPAASPSATTTSAANEPGNAAGGQPRAGSPYVPGAGPVTPVHSEGLEGAGGGGVGQSAINKARGVGGQVGGGTAQQGGSGE